MTTCYREVNSTVFNVSSTDVPCSGSDPTGCCAYGDLCMSNGICHYTQPNTAGGYYLQSCTDSTFQSAIGLGAFHCTTLGYPYIVYNTTIGLWACCSSYSTTDAQCSIATNETWAAPAPEALATLTSIEQKLATSTNALPVSSPASSLASMISPTTRSLSTTTTPLVLPASTPSSSLSKSPAVTSTSGTSGISMTTYSASVSSNTAAAVPTSTFTFTSTTSASASDSTASTHKTRLSPTASVGIGVGVVFGLIALLALTYLAILTLRKRKRKRQSSVATLFGGPDPSSDNHPRDHAFFSNIPGLGTITDAGLLSHGGYRPQRFTGEPQFQQEMSGVPVRYEATDHQRYGMGTGRGLR